MTQHIGNSDWQHSGLLQLQAAVGILLEDLESALELQRELHDIAYSAEERIAVQKPLLRQYAQALGSDRQALGIEHKALRRQINVLQASTIFLHDQASHVTQELQDLLSIANDTYVEAADFMQALSAYLLSQQAQRDKLANGASAATG